MEQGGASPSQGDVETPMGCENVEGLDPDLLRTISLILCEPLNLTTVFPIWFIRYTSLG